MRWRFLSENKADPRAQKLKNLFTKILKGDKENEEKNPLKKIELDAKSGTAKIYLVQQSGVMLLEKNLRKRLSKNSTIEPDYIYNTITLQKTEVESLLQPKKIKKKSKKKSSEIFSSAQLFQHPDSKIQHVDTEYFKSIKQRLDKFLEAKNNPQVLGLNENNWWVVEHKVNALKELLDSKSSQFDSEYEEFVAFINTQTSGNEELQALREIFITDVPEFSRHHP